MLLQEVQQCHLVVLPRLGAADAVSLVGVDLWKRKRKRQGYRQAHLGPLLCTTQGRGSLSRLWGSLPQTHSCLLSFPVPSITHAPHSLTGHPPGRAPTEVHCPSLLKPRLCPTPQAKALPTLTSKAE